MCEISVTTLWPHSSSSFNFMHKNERQILLTFLRPYVLVTTSYNLASYSSQLRRWSNKRHGRLWPDNLFIWTNNVGCTVLKKGEMGFYWVLFCVCQINKFILSVCTCVSNKRQNGWTDQVQILCGTSNYPRYGLLKVKI